MKKRNFLIIILTILSITFILYRTFFYPANPKLHRVKIGAEKQISEVYKVKYEKVIFIEGKHAKEKIELFCTNSNIKEVKYEPFDVLLVFVDGHEKGKIYPIYTYFDDLKREPFYDSVDFQIPYDIMIPVENVFVERLSNNSFAIRQKQNIN